MKLKDTIRSKKTIRATAKKFNISPAQSRADMQEAIDAGWEASQNDPVAKARWLQLFPSGEKPSVEEFIAVLAGNLQNIHKE